MPPRYRPGKGSIGRGHFLTEVVAERIEIDRLARLTLTEEIDLPPDWSAMDCTSPVTQTFIEPETEPFEAVMVALPLF